MVRQYMFDQVALVAVGVPCTEYAEGDSIEIEFSEDDWEVVQGHHGSVVRFKKPNNVAELKLIIGHGSPVNAQLMAQALTDKLTGVLASRAFLLKDLNGADIAWGSKSWVKKIPKMGKGTEPGPIEWTISVGDLEMNHGALGLLI